MKPTVRYVGRGDGWPRYVTEPNTGYHYDSRKAAETALNGLGLVGIRFIDENRFDLSTDEWLATRKAERQGES